MGNWFTQGQQGRRSYQYIKLALNLDLLNKPIAKMKADNVEGAQNIVLVRSTRALSSLLEFLMAFDMNVVPV